MGAGAQGVRDALFTVALIAASPSAQAACDVSAFGPRDIVCSGAISAFTLVNPRTVQWSGARVSTYFAMVGPPDGEIGFTMDARSSLQAVDGVSLTTRGAAIRSETPGLSGLAGPIAATGATSVALRAVAHGPGGAILLTTHAGATLSGGRGVAAWTDSGPISLDLGGAVSSRAGDAVAADAGGSIAIRTHAPIQAVGGDGVRAIARAGVAGVHSAGPIAATRDGIVAVGPDGVGVVVNADVTAGRAAVTAASGAGDIMIDFAAGAFVRAPATALTVQSRGGATTIRNRGTLEALAPDGIGVFADVAGGPVALQNDGVLRGGAYAVLGALGESRIDNTGLIDGRVVVGPQTRVDNAGVWSDAGFSIVGALVNRGALALGPSGGASAPFFALTAQFTPASTLTMRVGDQTSDMLYVARAVELGGVLALAPGAQPPRAGARYGLIYAGGGFSGQFSAVRSSLPQFAGLVSVEDSTLFVTVLDRDYRAAARTRNQAATAEALWRGAERLTPAGGAVLAALASASDKADALGRLSGEGATAADAAALRSGEMFSGVLGDQQSFWRDGRSRVWRERPTRETLEPVRGRRASAAPAPADAGRWRLWSALAGGQTRTGGASAQSATLLGGAMGLDYQLGDHVLLGGALGYSSNAFSTRGANGQAQGLHAGLYAGMKIGRFYMATSYAYGHYDNTTERPVAFGGAADRPKGQFASQEQRVRLELGGRGDIGALAIAPFVALEAARLSTQAYIENSQGVGANFALAYAARGARSTPSFVGLKAQSRLEMGAMRLTPWISLAWRHEWSGAPVTRAALTVMPEAVFPLVGERAGRDAAQIKLGADMEIARRTTAFAQFEGEFSKRGATMLGGRAGVRFGW